MDVCSQNYCRGGTPGPIIRGRVLASCLTLILGFGVLLPETAGAAPPGFDADAVVSTLPLVSQGAWSGGNFGPDGLLVSSGGPTCDVANGQCEQVGIVLDNGNGYVIATWLNRTGGEGHSVFWHSQHAADGCEGYAFHTRGPHIDGISPSYPLAFYDGCGRRLAQSTASVAPGSGPHLVAAWVNPAGSETRLYLDGVEVTASQAHVSIPGTDGGADEGVNDWPIPSQNVPQVNGTLQLSQGSRPFVGLLWDLTTASNVSTYDAQAHFLEVPEPSSTLLEASAIFVVWFLRKKARSRAGLTLSRVGG